MAFLALVQRRHSNHVVETTANEHEEGMRMSHHQTNIIYTKTHDRMIAYSLLNGYLLLLSFGGKEIARVLVLKHSAMPPLIVSNFSARADLLFLQTLFDQHVRDYLFFGNGEERFAIVDLDDDEYAEKAVAAWELYRAHKEHVKLFGEPKVPKKRAAPKVDVLDEKPAESDEMTLSELLGELPMSEVKPVKRSRGAAKEPAATLETNPFYTDIVSDGAELFVGRAPFGAAEIISLGQVANRRIVKDPSEVKARKVARKEQKEHKEDKETTAVKHEVEGAKVAPPAAVAEDAPDKGEDDRKRERRKREKKPQLVKTIFDDDDDSDDGEDRSVAKSVVAPVAAKHFTEEAVSTNVPVAAAKSSAGTAQAAKPPLQSAPSAPPRQVEASRPAPVVCELFARTSKDQCKFCGSDLHLSRHCPKKK